MNPDENASATTPLGVTVDTLAGEVRDTECNQVLATSQSQRVAIRQAREDEWEAICDRYATPSNLTLEEFNAKIERNNQEILRKFGH